MTARISAKGGDRDVLFLRKNPWLFAKKTHGFLFFQSTALYLESYLLRAGLDHTMRDLTVIII